jgi:hypothetical protein
MSLASSSSGITATTRTIALGSLNRGWSARQTSCTAPSSSHVAAMIGSKYYKQGVRVSQQCPVPFARPLYAL